MYTPPIGEESSRGNGPRRVSIPCTGKLPTGVCALLARSTLGIESNIRVCDASLPISSANTRDDAIQELLHRASPTSDPSHSARLTLALVSPQLINTHAFGQPQCPRQGDLLVKALLQQYFAREAMRYSTTQATETNSRVRQVV